MGDTTRWGRTEYVDEETGEIKKAKEIKELVIKITKTITITKTNKDYYGRITKWKHERKFYREIARQGKLF